MRQPLAAPKAKGIRFFEKYLTLWVALCIGAGIVLGKITPALASTLDGMAIYVGDAPVVSIPIAICLFFMMYPIMVKIDFNEVIQAGKSGRPVGLTLFLNWAIKPFTMYAIALFFLGTAFYTFIGPEAVDLVKMPFGLDLPVGARHGAGTVVVVDGLKMLEVPLWRSYLAGLGLEATVVKITDPDQIMNMGVMMTPALAVDGVVKSAGKILSTGEITRILGADGASHDRP